MARPRSTRTAAKPDIWGGSGRNQSVTWSLARAKEASL